MKRILLILILLMASNAHGFGLFGSADLGLGGPTKKPLRAETVAYCNRVVAAGGTCIDTAAVDAAYTMLAANNLTANALVYVAADFGVKKDGSNAVSKLYSLGGAAYDLVQAAGAAQPTWSANGQNGRPIITFDGTGDFLKAAAFTLNQPEYIFMVAKALSWTNGDYFVDGNTAGTMVLYQRSSTPYTAMYAGNIVGDNANFTLTGAHQTSALFNGATSNWWVDGASVLANGNAGASNAGGFTVGGNAAGSVNSHIAMCEIIVFNAAIATRATVEAFQKARWATP